MPALPAATVVLVRDPGADGAGERRGDATVEVFVLRRTASAAFAAGMYVFPGGRVDDADGVPEIEPFCDGLDDAAASAALDLERGGLAYWVAAVRECFEESGVLLARRRDGSSFAAPDSARREVHAGRLSMVELCRRHDVVLDIDRDAVHRPLGDASRRGPAAFRHPLLPGHRPPWSGGGARRR